MSTLSVPINPSIPTEQTFNKPNPPLTSLPVPNPTKSFWIDSSPDANPLAKEGSTGPLPEDADICIIGSGITGVSAAYHLALAEWDEPLRVVVLEARDFCSGATGRNGGHLTPITYEYFHKVSSDYGLPEAIKSVALENHTRDEILKFVSLENIADSVDLVKGGHIQMFVTEEEYAVARKDYEEAKKAGVGMEDVEWLTKDEMEKTYGTSFPAAKFGGHNIWPLKLVTHLYRFAKSKTSSVSLSLHTSTPVTSISHSSDNKRKWVLTTPRGSISCTSVLHATNAYASHLLPHLHGPTGIAPTRGQVIALRAGAPLEELTRTSWDANEGFEYWFPRPVKPDEKDTNPLVILGGGREVLEGDHGWYTTDDSECNEDVGKALKEFLPGLFKGKYYVEGREPEMEWTGIMGFTKIGDPFVGPVIDKKHPDSEEEYKGQYIAAGYSGHGMPRAFACAEAVALMIEADLKGKKWVAPEWFPERFLTWKRDAEGVPR